MSEFVDLGSFLDSNTVSSTIKSPASPSTPEGNAANTSAKLVEIPTLHQLCIRLISSKVERFPPEVFAAISESDWEEIVKHRHNSTKPKISSTIKIPKSSLKGGIDGLGRMCPAISDKVVGEIEECVPHLAESKVADTLIWKDCVEYKFKPLGPTRPKALLCPWTTLVEKLKKASNSLFDSVERENESAQNKKSIHDAITVLMDAPMSVDLLNETKIGKIISKCLKRLSKRPPQESSTWSEPIVLNLQSSSSESLSPEIHLKNILQAWKDLASNSGVKINKSPSVASTSSANCSGKNKQTSQDQHDMDMLVLKMCRSWRDLFQALSERKEHMLESHGAKMREKRQNMETTKHRVKKVGLKTSRPRLFSGNSIRAGGSVMLKRPSAGTSSVSSSSKINSWKQQVAVSKAGQLGRPAPKTKVSAFSAAVANATRPAKRKCNTVAFGRKREVELGNGKRMRLPNRDRDNKFQSNQLRNRLKNKAFSRY